MSAPTTDLLALLSSDPSAGILAAADLREQRADGARRGPYTAWENPDKDFPYRGSVCAGDGTSIALVGTGPTAKHVAAEANPAHALAAVRRWKRTAGRHVKLDRAAECMWCGKHWHCPDIRETADEARAYLGGTS